MDSRSLGDRSGEVTFEVPADLLAEAEQVAAELGVGVDVLAQTAFQTYLDGVRAARLDDLDEPGE